MSSYALKPNHRHRKGLVTDVSGPQRNACPGTLSGSGPAQLSLALLADYFENDSEAMEYYQDFKFAVIGSLPNEKNWVLTEKEIDAAVRAIRLKRRFSSIEAEV
jgi:hypothetical protein